LVGNIPSGNNAIFRAWENLTLDLKADRFEQSRIAAYEYPVSDRMKKVYTFMVETGFPNNTEEAINYIRHPMYEEGNGKYAFVGERKIFLPIILSCPQPLFANVLESLCFY
jgi:hypothetical protein